MPLAIFKRGKIWHYRGTIAGRRLRGSCQTEEKGKAERIAAEISARQWQGHLDGPQAVLTFAQAAMIYRAAEKSPRFLSKVEDYWKDALVSKITPGAIRQSALAILPDVSGATRNRQVIVPAQAIINHAAEQELCSRISVRRFPVEHREKQPATTQWIATFAAHANPHLAALALFMFTTGARISEALAVTWADISLEHQTALIRQTKISSERNARLTRQMIVAISNIEGERRGKVFKYASRSTAKTQWNAVIRRAGLNHLSFHACRHGFATTMLQAGIDPVTVAKRGGWKDITQLFKTYGHASDDITIIDRVFDTNLTPSKHKKRATY